MKKWIEKLIVLMIIFIAAVGVMMVRHNKDEQKDSYIKMQEATLPIIRLIYGEREINTLHGYTVGVDVATFRETIFPLSEERVLPIRIETYGREVTAVEYEVRSLDGSHLIERNLAVDLAPLSKDELGAEIVLMDLMEKGVEYLVTFILHDDQGEIGRYYTRVRTESDTAVAGAVEFALEFLDKTFLEEPDELIIAQLESKPGADNSSFGYTDIYSSHKHVLWGTLRPERSSQAAIDIHEFDRLMTSMTLSYSMTAVGEDGILETYEVEEHYGVRLVNGKYYLMTYERQANQQFPGGEVITGEGNLQLGVTSPDELPKQIIRDNKRTVFVYDGELRCYDSAANRLKTLFTFRNAEDDVRTEYDRHDIRVVNLNQNGDVAFLVYGYMNRGAHEGETGISFYRYQAASDALEEVFYIASRQNDQQVRAELNTLSYMNDDGLFYLIYEGTVYAIDIEGGEYVMLASDVLTGGLAVDEKNGMVAWQERDTPEVITVYNLNAGESWDIKANPGDGLKLLGFIDGDILYGLSRGSDVDTRLPYSLTAPMYALEIINMNGEIETRYQKDGVYLINVAIMSDRVTFGRQRLNGDVWESMDGDVLFCKAEAGQKQENLLKTSSSERQKLRYTLKLAMTNETKVISGMPKLLEKQPVVITLSNGETNEQEKYYAYSHGQLKGIFDTISAAISAIEADLGVVTDYRQQMIWNRGNRDAAAQVSLPFVETVEQPQMADYLELFLHRLGTEADCDAALKAGENVFDILKKNTERRLVNLEGCTLNQTLYYLYKGEPVLGIDGNNQAVLLVGYYEAYGETTVLYYDLTAGKIREVGFDEADGWFSGSGNRFISVLP